MTQPAPPVQVDVTDELLATIGELYFQNRMMRKAQQKAAPPGPPPLEQNGLVHAVRDEL